MVVPLLLTLLVLQSDAFSIDISDVWNTYESFHSKNYDKIEGDKKKLSFYDNAAFILKHNIETDLGQHSSWMGLNQWSDLDKEERKQLKCLSLDDMEPMADDSESMVYNDTIKNDPIYFDNRKLGLVTSIKNQGKCNGCWAFSAAGALEGQWAKHLCELRNLSAQNLIDCAESTGCAGGRVTQAYDYIIRHQGINAEEDYPFVEREQKCRFNPDKIVETCRQYIVLPYNNEKELKSTVYKVGPVSVSLYAEDPAFVEYKKGIYDSPRCNRKITHSVVAVGYGHDKRSGKDYWILKNSWGVRWGEKGYGKIVRGKNACRIASFSLYPVV